MSGIYPWRNILACAIPTIVSSVPITALGKLEYVTKARETLSYNKMLAAMCFGIVFVPSMYAIFQNIREWVLKKRS